VVHGRFISHPDGDAKPVGFCPSWAYNSGMKDASFEYLTYGPPAEEVRHLVFLLHGYGRNALAMEKMALSIRAEHISALVFSLHAPEPMREASFAPDDVLHVPDDPTDMPARRQWFAIDGGLDVLIRRLDDCATRINRFMDIQRDFYGLSDRDLALVGFSQGGGTALYTAYTRAAEIGAIVCHSAIIINRNRPVPAFKNRPKTFYLYGDADPEFPQSHYEDSWHWVRDYTHGHCRHHVVPNLRHTTSTESRRLCAKFLKETLV
jgi:phospholipase/carboxylesterase